MRPKLIATTIALLLTMFACGMSQAQTLVVWQKDGSKVYYDLEDQPRTTFTKEDLIITTKNETVNFPLSKMMRYTYEGGSVGIENVQAKEIIITHRADNIIATGLPSGKTLCVYSVDGKLLVSKRSDGSARLTLSLSQLPLGVYVVKAEEVTYKFIKR